MPLWRKWRTRCTKPVSRCRAPSRPSSVRAGSAFETTVPAAIFSPFSSSTPETRSPSSVMRLTGLAGADRGAGGAGRGGHRLADRAHAALGDREPGVARGLAGEAVQQREHGIVRARPEVRAEHGVEGERALEQRRLEDLLEHVVDVDAGDAQELAHVLAAEQADVEAERGRAHEVGAPAAAEARGLAVVLLRQDARELQHARVVGRRGPCGRRRTACRSRARPSL